MNIAGMKIDAPVIFCDGRGVDSLAGKILLKKIGLIPEVLTFADLSAEKPETYNQPEMDAWQKSVGFPETDYCKKITLDSTPYEDLEGNCVDNETLPSLAFGMKSCSIKWKQGPQDKFIMGCKRGPMKSEPHPIWEECKKKGTKPIKMIGYDFGPADLRRSKKLKSEDENFRYIYPLQHFEWDRKKCVDAIKGEGLPVPVKSACYFCPASKEWELFWLAGKHPELFMRALRMERVALTGKHSRYDEVEFGDSWENYIARGERFPSSNTTVGLGRSFAWNQWAVLNDVVDSEGNYIGDREKLMRISAAMNGAEGNAQDSRPC